MAMIVNLGCNILHEGARTVAARIINMMKLHYLVLVCQPECGGGRRVSRAHRRTFDIHSGPLLSDRGKRGGHKLKSFPHSRVFYWPDYPYRQGVMDSSVVSVTMFVVANHHSIEPNSLPITASKFTAIEKCPVSPAKMFFNNSDYVARCNKPLH